MRWTVTPVVRGTAAGALAVLLAALALGRADLVVLVGPVLVVVLLAVGRGRPGGEPSASARVAGLLPEIRPFRVDVRVDGLAGAQLAVVRVPSPDGLPQGDVLALDGAAGEVATSVTVTGLRWGERVLACPDLLAVGPDAAFVRGPAGARPVSATVLPGVADVGSAPLAPRASGLVGSHRTRRPGDGSDLLDVREFGSGDRMRRIDWRVTARHGTAPSAQASAAGSGGVRLERLFVRRTAVDSDADLVVCVDSRVDLAGEVARWSHPELFASAPGTGSATPGGSLDTAVRAAVGLAAGQLRTGDRVAMVDLGRTGAGLRAGTGLRHLQRLRLTLAGCRVQPQGRYLRLRPAAVPVGATVVVLSPFVDDAVVSLTTALRRRGDRVLAVDTLPDPLVRGSLTPVGHRALDLVLAERRWRLTCLANDGIPVLRWDPPVVAATLAKLRHAGAGRPGGVRR